MCSAGALCWKPGAESRCVVCRARCVKQLLVKPGGEDRFVVCKACVLCVKQGV